MCLAVASVAVASDLDDIAATIWDEARGEGFKGRQFVASVIYNRAKGNAAKMRAVCAKPKQFSGWKAGKAPAVVLRNDKDTLIYNECRAFAKALLNGTFKPCTTATHYHATYVNPKWASRLTYLKTVGRHKFYV